MKLIVGLGNPGKKYDGTRHNVGFQVIAELHKRFGQPRPSAKFDSELVQVQVSSDNLKVLLQSPLTFMNLSGKAVRAALDFYKISTQDLLVICDDLNLDLGRLRFRPSGSAGGQNGLKDIIQKLGSQEFARLRVGVGKPPQGWEVSNYVLSKFRDDESVDLQKAIERAADGVLTWIDSGTAEAMNRFNADPNQPKRSGKKPKQMNQADKNRKKARDQGAGKPPAGDSPDPD